ncbi:hypothetical protein J3R30DRAFT_3524253 [Lentinula aciculospora]|uniref:Uncharacterized protein n=1 Tax=Lentinula aciculospora TaxID=153920 RepID=A0A9W9A2S7_9AGAR|nr:hypothetical protein J3R30DRAFT_3524253 [Lentinula aciculospora]
MAASTAFTSIFLQGNLDDMHSSDIPVLHTSNDFLNPPATEQGTGTDSEPLQDEEVAQLRARVLDMDIQNSKEASERERELARMVLRLTESSRPTSAQIASQGAIIVDLSIQRDYLIQQAEEDRARWESERDGWERASEALIAQRNTKDHYSNRHQELERYCSVLQTDNEDLRRREQRLSRRLTSLEDEMVNLKPVLLLDPFPASATESSLAHASAYLSSLPYPAASGKEAARVRRSRKRRPEPKSIVRLEEGPNAPADSNAAKNYPDRLDAGTPEAPIQDHIDSKVLPSKSVPSEQHVSRRTEPPGTLLLWPAHILPPATPPLPSVSGHLEQQVPFHSSISPPPASSLPKPATSLTSDARTEHLLLAARMIGRKRAGFAAGIVDAELEREQKERKEKEKEWREIEKAKRKRERENKDKEAEEKSKSEKGKEKLATESLPPSAGGRRAAGGKRKRKAVAKSVHSKAPKIADLGDETEHEALPEDEIIVGSSKQSRTRQTGRPKPRTLSPSSSAGTAQRSQLTGMDSLLNAARSMMEPSSSQFPAEGEANEGRMNLNNRAGPRRPASALGSEDILPPAKKRKGLAVDPNRPMRTPSALDVLADQAAAAVSTSTTSSDKDDKKGKMTENDFGDEDAEGEYEDEPTVFSSPIIRTNGPRRSSRRAAPSRPTTNARIISSAKSSTGSTENLSRELTPR